MPVPVEEQVLGFQIAVDDFQRVEVVESESDFGCVKLGDWIGEPLYTRN